MVTFLRQEERAAPRSCREDQPSWSRGEARKTLVILSGFSMLLIWRMTWEEDDDDDDEDDDDDDDDVDVRNMAIKRIKTYLYTLSSLEWL